MAGSDGAAFEAIVGRHGPMVLRACSAVIGDEHEAHDAFQATFLVLVRKAGSIRAGESLGPWLHEVAAAGLGMRPVGLGPSGPSRAAGGRPVVPGGRANREIDDLAPRRCTSEVGRLPDRYRTAVVLCDFEGLTQEQAAARLGWPLGTVRSRLARGRDRLRDRLRRRGLASASALSVLSVLPEAGRRGGVATCIFGGGCPLWPSASYPKEGSERCNSSAGNRPRR